MTTLSIIIPLFNEEDLIEELLNRVLSAPLSIEKEIIIVNDGSTDSSAERVDHWIKNHTNVSVQFIHKENGGKGSAIKAGIQKSTGEILIIQDADLEYDPRDYQHCIDPILNQECCVVYGSRELGGRNANASHLSFYLGGLLVTAWTNFLFASGLTDEPTCYKTFLGDLIRSIPLTGNKFDWEPEITGKLLRMGFEIKEVPIQYYPRKSNEGKKIKWKDGVDALYTLLKFRFSSISQITQSLCQPMTLPRIKQTIVNAQRNRYLLFSVLVIAFIARLLISIPGLETPLDTFTRPDSATYIGPAESMIENFSYNQSAQSTDPASLRTPGYPFFLAILFFIFQKNFTIPVLVNILLSTGTVLLTYIAARRLTSRPISILAASFVALNLTTIAITPLYLSDTLFMFFSTIHLLLFFRFYKTGHPFSFLLCIFTVALGCYIRPINIFWIVPGLVLLFFHGNLPWRQKFSTAILSIVIFLGILFPWMLRNQYAIGEFSIDTLSGSSLRYHNVATLESSLTGESAETIRQRLMAEDQTYFETHSTEYQQEGKRDIYRKKLALKTILQHPWQYIRIHFRPSILIPDVATFSENLKMTTSGRGTFDILNRKGIWAAITHYFGDHLWLLYLYLPLCAISCIMYLGCLGQLFHLLINKQFYLILFFFAFAYFFLFIPGPITMPRYQLPAIPTIAIFAALFIGWSKSKISSQLIKK